MADSDDEALAAEAIRLHERYTIEVIERFNLCPWAKGARLGGEVERFVLPQADLAAEPTLDLISRLESRASPPPIVIAIFPRLVVTPRAFDELGSRIKAADQARHGGKPTYVSATFHPDYRLDTRSASAMVPFFRRSPDPSLQIVHFGTVEKARGPQHGTFLFDYSAGGWAELGRRLATLSVVDRIAADNKALVDQLGLAAFEGAYRDIMADRARAYRRFDLGPDPGPDLGAEPDAGREAKDGARGPVSD